MEKDYSRFINNPSQLRDDRPFWLRLISSLKLSFFIDSKKEKNTDQIKRGVGVQIKGGVEF
jgi:hypothetical protein